MSELFANLKDSIVNTLEVADKCEPPYYFAKEPLMPAFVPEDGSEPYEYLRKLTFDGLERKYPEITDKIRERTEYELNIIKTMGFVDYFLIVWDFINWSETHGVPIGPGRGSGVGSIVAYAIGITKVETAQVRPNFRAFSKPRACIQPRL